MLQLYELCRLCAQKKRNKVDLFTGIDDEEGRILLAKISLCLSVQVTREDMLPKMVCTDCQKAVEQFNAFRVKCHKAEERLHKMLSLALPNKLTVTRIKQECLETDFQETNQMKLDSPNPYLTLKSLKLEVEEPDIDNTWGQNNSSDLIQIISEEIVNQQCTLDIKQPQIEIISENYNEDQKQFDLNYETEICDIKLVPEILLRAEENNESLLINNNVEAETIIKVAESDQEVESPVQRKRKRKPDLQERDLTVEEIDEKYLRLNEGEVCDIDFEEMDAFLKKKQNPDAKFCCDRCGKTFKFFKCLRKHKKTHDEPDVFVCDFCKNDNLKNFEFSSFKSLKNHILRKHLMDGTKKYKCDLCEAEFASQGQLASHCRRVHYTSSATCSTCGKIFKNKTRLNYHLKVHQEGRPYICDQCGQTFKWSNALKVHIQWHRQEKNFLCSECGKKFTAKKNLLEHLNIHAGKRPYVCAACNASFTQLSAYSKHIYLHNEGRRIHKCDKCGKRYSHAYLLKQHLLRHTGIRPYECSTCHRTFKSQSDLCCHVKIHQEKQYGCHVCGKKFALSKTLKDHMVRHTGIKHKCPIPKCEKTYTQRFALTKHFTKYHSGFKIVRKRSGKKSHLPEKVTKDYIEYDYSERNGLV